MAQILGLDLGTNSVGWAIVDDKKNKILGMGSRIFPEGVIAKTIGTGEREESKNAARRDSRQQRRQYYRKRLRKIKLLRVLTDFKMCPVTHKELDAWAKWDKAKGKTSRKAPTSSEYKNWLYKDPYILRDKALKEDLTDYELGRVFYHIIQRRGFLSNRKGKDDGAIFKGKEGMSGINDTQNQIGESTLGSYLSSITPKKGEPYKKIVDENGNELRVRARYTLRDMYIEEFSQIWERQAKVLKLDDKTAIKTRMQFLKGSLENKRNKQKIEKLFTKYGKDNIDIEEIVSDKNETILFKVVSNEKVPLKIFLGGEIYHDEEGILKHKSQESVLFWQRPLRSQKASLAKCRFEPDVKTKDGKYIQKGKTPCHISHPLFEEFRAWQFINNIEYGKRQSLDQNQKESVLDLINSKDKSFNFSDIPARLKMTYETWNYANDFKVVGNYTTKHILNLFSTEMFEKNKEELWHCFHFYEDSDALIAKLNKDFGLLEKDEAKIDKIKLKEDYSNVSLKAISQITHFLKKGHKMSDATILGGVKNAFGKYWDYFKESHELIEKDVLMINRDKSNKEGEAIEKIKLYLSENEFGFEENDKRFIKLYHHSQEIEEKPIKENIGAVDNLRNPIVQQGVNETRRLVNQLIKEYGSFDRIQVELGRDVKNSKEGRQRQSYRINENRTKNDEARKLLSDYGLKHTRENIQKVLLYKEMQDKGVLTICPYTNKAINISDVLGRENLIQIEHIIPKSISLDDSFANKTLCDAKFNTLKGNLTPYQFYLKNSDAKLWGGASTWEAIEKRAFNVLPYSKAKRFVSRIKTQDIKVQSSFIERQLNDTRYISIKTKEMMLEVCKDVRVLPGSLTSELRHLWGLNNILQPVLNIDLPTIDIEENKVYPHYVVLDSENNKALLTSPIYAEKPALKANECTIVGLIEKGVFKANEKHISLKLNTPSLNNGEYWLKIKLSEPKKQIQIFKDKPEATEENIVIKGKIEKGKFKNDGLGQLVASGYDNGSFWAQLAILNKVLIPPKKDEQPKKSSKQILLFGEVKENVFKSFIYECATNEPDGKYWLLIDIDTETAEFSKAIHDKPNVSNQEIIIEGTVNSTGLFVSELDVDHQIQTDLKQGKYWFVFDQLGELNDFSPVLEDIPTLKANQTLLEGAIWVDKYSGEIKFDPKKNRDDHRHHAIDALVIALSKQSYFQQLSIYNGVKEAKRKGHKFDKEQHKFPMPWESFHSEVKQEAEQILIAHKQKTEVLTLVKKHLTKNGKRFLSVGNAVRGQLHKENVYGKRQAPVETKPGYHIRKAVSELKDNQINKIVDPVIREIIREAKKEETLIKAKIATLEKSKKKTKTEEEDRLINKQIEILKEDIQVLYTLKNTKGGERVPIKKVRIREEMSNAQILKDKNQWVNPRNNHHILIYKTSNGELREEIISFWEVVERMKQGEDIYQLPKAEADAEILFTLQENDMFLLGLNPEEYEDNKDDVNILSKYLYRVQKISSKDYSFRHHLASTLNNKEQEIRIHSIKRLNEFNLLKVKIDLNGNIGLI